MSVKFENFSDEELEAELDRRAAVKRVPIPRPFDESLSPEYLKLAETCSVFLNNIQDHEQRHAIYERAMELIYGKEIWEYISLKVAEL